MDMLAEAFNKGGQAREEFHEHLSMLLDQHSEVLAALLEQPTCDNAWELFVVVLQHAAEHVFKECNLFL